MGICVCERDRLGGVIGNGRHTNVCVCACVREIGYGVLVVSSDTGICVCVP